MSNQKFLEMAHLMGPMADAKHRPDMFASSSAIEAKNLLLIYGNIKERKVKLTCLLWRYEVDETKCENNFLAVDWPVQNF